MNFDGEELETIASALEDKIRDCKTSIENDHPKYHHIYQSVMDDCQRVLDKINVGKGL